MFRQNLILATLCLALLAATAGAIQTGHAGHEHASDVVTMHIVLEHYETVRKLLVHDTLEGTADHAQAIETGLATLHQNFDPATAEVDAASKDKALDLLGRMHLAATSLVQSTSDGDLEATRGAFYLLTQPMVQYRDLMTSDKPVVAYCPMHKKSWLQDDDQIGNPYAGQSMPKCGSVVSGGR